MNIGIKRLCRAISGAVTLWFVGRLLYVIVSMTGVSCGAGALLILPAIFNLVLCLVPDGLLLKLRWPYRICTVFMLLFYMHYIYIIWISEMAWVMGS
ncbi:MAG: hypothetical protein U1E27_10490, partial [Kiritimatiellia bacterium]|nr:hypothetical protein [Kiritimatiellia bacterium]